LSDSQDFVGMAGFDVGKITYINRAGRLMIGIAETKV